MVYTNDLNGYIKNMESVAEEAKAAGNVEVLAMVQFAIQTAKEFKGE